ncbi:unnamed protein product [Miscanthus lutarioriparius]|uniref:Uncharacterized protein n=1 Tax=Miscanthus lutarioriparius TaxID=422564 RepID=A0A811PVQ9_9POAL|nr:unnamed protein product [Miscanthus lutarioriparius]
MEHVKAKNIVTLTKPFLDVCKKILPVLVVSCVADLQLPGMHKKRITCLAGRVVSDTIAIFASTSSHGIVVIWEMAIEPTPSEDANVHTMGNAMDHGGEVDTLCFQYIEIEFPEHMNNDPIVSELMKYPSLLVFLVMCKSATVKAISLSK